MEVIIYLAVRRSNKIFYGIRTVVPVTTKKDYNIRCNASDFFNCFFCKSHPVFIESRTCHFVQKFKAYIRTDFSVTGCHYNPQVNKTFLISWISKKSCFQFIFIKRITAGFVKIQNNIESCILTPLNGIVQIIKTFFSKVSVFILNDIKVKRKTNMIHPPGLNLFNVSFCNEFFKMFFLVITLAKPAAEIYTFHITVPSIHGVRISPYLFEKYQNIWVACKNFILLEQSLNKII